MHGVGVGDQGGPRSSTTNLDVRLLRAQYRADLFDDWLPFMDSHVVDRVNGGFPCGVRPDGSRESNVRMTWFEGRGIWVYSHLYRVHAPDQRYLDIADRAVRLLDRSRPSPGPGGRPRLLSSDGSPAGPPDHEVYSDLFVAEGLAAFGRATDDDLLWQLAVDTTLDCVRRFDSPDYLSRLGYVLKPNGDPVDSETNRGVRPLGVWMLIIRTLTELIGYREDAALQQNLDSAIDTVLTRYLNPRYGLLSEALDHELRPGSGPAPNFVYLGHAIEALWMIMDAAAATGRPTIFDTAAGLFRRHCECAADVVYGGLFRAMFDVDQQRFTLDKTLWVQQEAAIGALMVAQHRGDAWGAQFFLATNTYLHNRFPLRENGSVLWRGTADRTAAAVPTAARVENYHHPRFLMRVLSALETLDRQPQPGPGTTGARTSETSGE